MLFTVGHKQNYLDSIAINGTIGKMGKTDDYKGGCVFLTREDAELYLNEIHQENSWCVWGLDTTIENTEYIEGERFRRLLAHCVIINILDTE